jgi:hypothetical protein
VYGARFTRKTARDAVNSCAGCHTVEDLAYGFVNSDRFDPKLGKRMSFEERVMRCYAGPMDGYVPTLYDPAIRDIRILARAIANHLQLSEGARPPARASTANLTLESPAKGRTLWLPPREGS